MYPPPAWSLSPYSFANSGRTSTTSQVRNSVRLPVRHESGDSQPHGPMSRRAATLPRFPSAPFLARGPRCALCDAASHYDRPSGGCKSPSRVIVLPMVCGAVRQSPPALVRRHRDAGLSGTRLRTARRCSACRSWGSGNGQTRTAASSRAGWTPCSPRTARRGVVWTACDNRSEGRARCTSLRQPAARGSDWRKWRETRTRSQPVSRR